MGSPQPSSWTSSTATTGTGFTGMERLTGWHRAIMLAMQARGIIRQGDSWALLLDGTPTAGEVMAAVRERGIEFTVRWSRCKLTAVCLVNTGGPSVVVIGCGWSHPGYPSGCDTPDLISE